MEASVCNFNIRRGTPNRDGIDNQRAIRSTFLVEKEISVSAPP